MPQPRSPELGYATVVTGALHGQITVRVSDDSAPFPANALDTNRAGGYTAGDRVLIAFPSGGLGVPCVVGVLQ
jgi:hypothetical protein